MSLILKLEAEPGDGIEATAEQAQIVSDILNIAVDFQFNEVTCFCRPGGSAEKLIKDFYEEIKPVPPKRKFVRSF